VTGPNTTRPPTTALAPDAVDGRSLWVAKCPLWSEVAEITVLSVSEIAQES